MSDDSDDKLYKHDDIHSGPIVLVIEDDANIALSLQRSILKTLGSQYPIVWCTRRAQVQTLFENPKITIFFALVDVKLPEGDTLDLLRVLRERGVPLLVVTGSDSDDVFDECGSANVMLKPFSSDILENEIRQRLGLP